MGGAHELDIPEGANVTEGQVHDACIVLLGYAIGVAGCRKKTLRKMTRPVFEAIGAIPYDAQPRGPWGKPLKTSSEGGDR